MMTPEKIQALWCEHLAGASLSEDEQASFAAALERQPDLEDTMQRDKSLDALLRMVARVATTEEEFVHEWERRLSAELATAVDAPPIAVPTIPPPIAAPLLAAPPVATAFRSGRRSRPASRASWVGPVVTAACLAVTAGIVAAVWHGRPRSTIPSAEQRAESPRSPKRLAQSPTPRIDDFRTVPRSDGNVVPDVEVIDAHRSDPDVVPAVWYVGGPRDERLPPGRHELTAGKARVAWNDATQLEVSAPLRLEVRDDGSLTLERGRLQAFDLATGGAARLTTPTSCVTTHAGAFEVAVDDSGATDVEVLSGALELEPATAQDHPVRTLRLAAGEFERARMVAPSGNGAASPIFSTVTGPDDRFAGLISLEGETLQFGSPTAFDDFGRQVLGLAANSPEKLLREWPALVRSLGGVGGVSISVQRNGGLEEFRTLDDLFRMLEAKASGGASSFQGSINVNGKEMKFGSPAEFEAAKKTLRGSLEWFGGESR